MQLRLTVEYEGTAYRGWQLQPDGPTVQAVLEQALSTALRERVRVRGAGRTDAGVHACGQIAAVRVREVPADLERLQKSLNALTPDDVAVRDITVVDDAFDPRRHARSRVYEYRIWNVAAPSPFWRRHAWHVPSQLDVAAMDEAARVLEGEHDFASFRAADAEPVRSTVRRVLESSLRVDGRLLVYRVEATAFLKHMVRNVVGTLVEVGRGERVAGTFRELLAVRDRTRAGATAPAHGLVLVNVRY
ncbi:MAG: tRNA pseudouridine(38-40) synthase TruA [Deltaproteobacteria bacterium]|nr:MAG: tRNA pseudouridine(38-40) synthase TruA [Deltaproteobacteria bacterium]TMA48459.1 MAG: tRNA pseudouridine(38-40) synthase TruA [Deltaproteobacteria bacterium]